MAPWGDHFSCSQIPTSRPMSSMDWILIRFLKWANKLENFIRELSRDFSEKKTRILRVWGVTDTFLSTCLSSGMGSPVGWSKSYNSQPFSSQWPLEVSCAYMRHTHHTHHTHHGSWEVLVCPCFHLPAQVIVGPTPDEGMPTISCRSAVLAWCSVCYSSTGLLFSSLRCRLSFAHRFLSFEMEVYFYGILWAHRLVLLLLKSKHLNKPWYSCRWMNKILR